MEGIKKEKLDMGEVAKRGIDTWGIWEKGESEFDWSYTTDEHCFILEGSAEITANGETVTIEKGDYVVFPAGLSCRWKVTHPLKKRYRLL